MNVLKTKVAGIVTAVVLAAVGTSLLVIYVKGAESRALKGEKPASVLVVTSTIPKGTRAEDLVANVRAEQVPAKVKAVGSVTSLGSLAGKVAAVDLMPGEQLMSSRFVTPAQASSASVPPGALQITVALDAVRAVGGMVRPGDTVGVLASFDGDAATTHLILQKVRVTDVRGASGEEVKPRTGAASTALTGSVQVTLALDAPSVERVVFAAEHGKLWLTSEPTDANEAGTKVQTAGSVNG